MILNEQNNGWNLDAVASGFGYKTFMFQLCQRFQKEH